MYDYNFDSWRHYFPHLLIWENKLESSGWKFIGKGRHRRVIRRKNVIIKIPYQPDGMKANEIEYNLYKNYRNDWDSEHHLYYAPCKLLLNGCLMMRYVKVIDNDFPDWAARMIDGPQVGYYKNRIVAFDFADETDELQ